MAQHAIQFTGKVSWEGQMNGLPPEIHAYVLFDGDGENDAVIANKIIEDQAGQFIRARGMFVQRDQGQIIDLRQAPQDRMYIPFRWLVYMTPSIHKLNGELSLPDSEGVERLKDGSEPRKN
jgi:hypothetical protein